MAWVLKLICPRAWLKGSQLCLGLSQGGSSVIFKLQLEQLASNLTNTSRNLLEHSLQLEAGGCQEIFSS